MLLSPAQAGAEVVIHYHTSTTEAEKTTEFIRQSGNRAMMVRADVRKTDEVNSAVDQVMKELGRIDILVNNAGYALGGSFLKTSEEEWTRQFDTLAGGYFRFTKLGAPPTGYGLNEY